jgi:7-cyano-7-deazaguanine reductase
MVESKSAKLYLNSFDMCKMGENVKDAIINYENQVKKDLEESLKTAVSVCFFPSGSELNGYDAVEDYTDLHWELREKAQEITITDYSAQEDHLKFVKMHPNVDAPVTSKWFTNALRSRCRHTKQKDTGAAYIYIKSKNGMAVEPESLFKQIVSLREVNEFHEFCAEKLFVTIMTHEEVEDCCVTLLYSRRGSLDINPVRASSVKLLPEVLFNVNKFTNKAQGQ